MLLMGSRNISFFKRKLVCPKSHQSFNQMKLALLVNTTWIRLNTGFYQFFKNKILTRFDRLKTTVAHLAKTTQSDKERFQLSSYPPRKTPYIGLSGKIQEDLVQCVHSFSGLLLFSLNWIPDDLVCASCEIRTPKMLGRSKMWSKKPK